MAQLTPEQFNKPCLMTYGEIAERLAHIFSGNTSPKLELTVTSEVAPDELAHVMAEALLKLEKVDVR